MEKIKSELREIKARGDEIIANAEVEKRGLNDAETKQIEELQAKAVALKSQLGVDQFRSTLDSLSGRLEQSQISPNLAGEGDAEYRGLVRDFLAGKATMSEVRGAAAKMELRSATTSNVDAVIPVSIEVQVVKILQRFIMRQLATVHTYDTIVNIPVVSDLGAAAFIAEGGTFGETDDTFAKVVLGAHKVGKITKITEELLRDSGIDIWPQFIENVGMAIGRAEENAFMIGDGTGKPTGVFPSAAVGKTAASATVIAADDIIDLMFSLDEEYDADAKVIMHRDTLKAISKLKDAANNYLLLPTNWLGDKPATLFGKPVYTSRYAPTIGAAKRPIIVGDIKHYMIGDRTGLFIQPLWEKYAGEGVVGIRAYRRTDGKLTRADAVKALVMA